MEGGVRGAFSRTAIMTGAVIRYHQVAAVARGVSPSERWPALFLLPEAVVGLCLLFPAERPLRSRHRRPSVTRPKESERTGRSMASIFPQTTWCRHCRAHSVEPNETPTRNVELNSDMKSRSKYWPFQNWPFWSCSSFDWIDSDSLGRSTISKTHEKSGKKINEKVRGEGGGEGGIIIDAIRSGSDTLPAVRRWDNQIKGSTTVHRQ